MSNRINVQLSESQLLALVDLLEGEGMADLQATLERASTKAAVVENVKRVMRANMRDRDVFVRRDRGWC